MNKLHKISLTLTDEEMSSLRDSLYTAETKYRYESRNFGDRGPKTADKIKQLLVKINNNVEGTSQA